MSCPEIINSSNSSQKPAIIFPLDAETNLPLCGDLSLNFRFVMRTVVFSIGVSS